MHAASRRGPAAPRVCDPLIDAALGRLRPAMTPPLLRRLDAIALRTVATRAFVGPEERAMRASAWLLTRFLPSWLRTRPATLMHRTPGTPPMSARVALADELHQTLVRDCGDLIVAVESTFNTMGRPSAQRAPMIALAETPAAAMLVLAHRGPRPRDAALPVGASTWGHFEVALGTALSWATPVQPGRGSVEAMRGAVSRAATNRVLALSAVELFEQL